MQDRHMVIIDYL